MQCIELTYNAKNRVIRDATLNDLAQINHLLYASKAYWGYGAEFMAKFMALFAINEAYIKGNTLKIVSQDTVFIGFYSLHLHDDGILELDHFFIHPAYIGKGYGKDLWQHCCQTARSFNKNEFVLWSDPNVELFYRKMGCEKIAMKPSSLLPNRQAPVMRFHLKA